MKTFIINFTLIVLIPLTVFAKTSNPLNAQKITENFYLIQGGDSNSAALITSSGVVVVDFGNLPSTGEHMINLIRGITKQKITHVILTHYHDDHTAGLSALPSDVIIIGHENIKKAFTQIAYPRWKDLSEVQYPEYIKNLRIKLDKVKTEANLEHPKTEKELNETLIYFEDYKKIRFIPPTIEFSKQLRFTVGNETIELYHPGQAHTQTDCVVYFPNQKILCIGDLIFNEAFPFIDKRSRVNTAGWIHALSSAYLEYDCTYVIPGHGPMGNKEIIEHQRQLLVDLRNEVKTVFLQGKSLEDAKILVRMDKYKDLQWFAGLPRAIEAIYDELEIEKNK